MLILFLFQPDAYASDFGLKVQLHGGIQYTTDVSLRGHYDRDAIISYGSTGVLTHSSIAAGLFVKVQGYSFVVTDHFPTSELRMKGKWTVLGLQKDFHIRPCNLFFRLGLSFHQDDLKFADTKDNRVGSFYSLGFEVHLSKHFSAFIEGAYVHERLKIPYYVTFMYSRHQAFLAGKDLQTGGVLLHAGISYSIIK